MYYYYLPSPIVVCKNVPPAGSFRLVVSRFSCCGFQLFGVGDGREHGHTLSALLVQPPHLPWLSAVPALRRRHRGLTSSSATAVFAAFSTILGGLLQDGQVSVPFLLRRILLYIVIGARLGRCRRYVQIFHFPVRTHRGRGERARARVRTVNG